MRGHKEMSKVSKQVPTIWEQLTHNTEKEPVQKDVASTTPPGTSLFNSANRSRQTGDTKSTKGCSQTEKERAKRVADSEGGGVSSGKRNSEGRIADISEKYREERRTVCCRCNRVSIQFTYLFF